MAERQTRNVSLTPHQDRFVAAMVAAGRYRTASEAVRDGLRMLELAEHRRLLEKWLYDGLSAEEESQLPPELLRRARSQLDTWIDEGVQAGDRDGWIDGDDAKARLNARLADRFPSSGS